MDKRVIAGILVFCAVLLGVGVWIGSKNARIVPPTDGEEISGDTIIGNQDWSKGNPSASVTLIEYGDFQCPACKAYYPLIKEMLSKYPDKVRVVWRQFPLVAIHDKAYDAARAVEAAGKQGKFWEMHDRVFDNQETWVKDPKYMERFAEYAATIGIVVEQWQADVSDQGVEAKIQTDRQSGDRLGVTGTPSFFVNGGKIELPGSLEKFMEVINGVAAKVTPEAAQSVHMHFDVAVYRDGKQLDLAKDEFMDKNDSTHFHDNNGEVAHIHKSDATLGKLIEPLGIDLFGQTQLVVNDNEMTSDWRTYKPNDLDKVILAFGQAPTKMVVTDKACIYSEKCPERGAPPAETCVGGLETPCE